MMMANLIPSPPDVGASSNAPPFTPRRTVNSADWQRQVSSATDSVRRHWAIAATVLFVLLAAGAVVLWIKAKPSYLSNSVVFVSPKFPKMLATDSEVELPYDSYIQDQIQTVKRYDIISDAIAKLSYSVRHRSGPVLPSEVKALQRDIEVYRIGMTYQITIGLRGPSPNGLAEIVNAVTNVYVEKEKNEEFYGLDNRLTTLTQEKARIQSQIDQTMAEQAGLMQQLGVAMIPSPESTVPNPYDATIQKLHEQLATAREQRQAAEADLATYKDSGDSTNSLDNAADDAASADSGTSTMRNTLNARRAALMEEMNGLRPENPVYQKDKSDLASIDNMMSDLKRKAGDRVQSKAKRDVARSRMLELQLEQELNAKTHSAMSAAPKFQRANELGPQIASLQKAYDAIDDRIRDLELESSSPGSIHMSTMALEPIGPEKNKLPIYLVIVLLGSLIGSVFSAYLVDFLDTRIHTPRDVEKVVGFHPLGVLLDDDEFGSEISGEYYFRLAAGIDHAVRSTGARTFLFTSPAHGSGTSTVVQKLSERLQSLDLKARTINASGIDAAGELSPEPQTRPEFLLKDRNKIDEMQAVPIAGLSVAPAVPRRSQDANSVGSMARAVHEQYDLVLIDASPLPISANTEYLARVADATVLVVRSSATTRQELERAAHLLDRLQVPGVAVVLNKMSGGRADRALKTELSRYQQSFARRQKEPPTSKPQRDRASA
jgi:polysaccharide biosynthesis transport protein